MPPNFNQKTIDTLAKRAAYLCSNPDCRKSTVGPNSDPKKSTVIGEAAHIFGARSGAKRYCSKMTGAGRAEITNAIWLCRNCHKLIDTDEKEYTSEILFAWREQHEKYVQSELGSSVDRIKFEEHNSKLLIFKHYPPLVRRIVIDKPDGWEWRLTAELMRYLNQPLFRKFKDLRDGLYIRSQGHIDSEEVIGWIQNRLAESSNLLTPIVSLLDRLNESWGAPGESGDIEEIHHICCLIKENLEEILKHEEQIYFVNVPEKYERLMELMKDLLGSQVDKLAEIPDGLDEFVTLIDADHGGTTENPYVVKKTIEFDVPKGWERQMNREIKRINGGSGIWPMLFILILLIWLVF